MIKAVYTYLKNYILPSITGRGWGVGLLILTLASCDPEPPLHLYDSEEVSLDLPVIDLELEVYWDYELEYGVDYDWKALWYYGWDDVDRDLWGEIGYTEPTAFNLRRYYTGDAALAPHTSVIANTVEGNRFRGRYEWGFWDILVWNRVQTIDGVQSLHFDEETTLDSIFAYTNPSMNSSRYHAPRYTRSFYPPEALFAGYDQAIEINRDLRGFHYEPEQNVWVRTLDMLLKPITYIYLTQVILHNNQGRITAIDGSANLSGMARNTCLNTGRAGGDAVSIYYGCRMKYNRPLVPYKTRTDDEADDEAAAPSIPAERVDIIGGRLMTFGICNLVANAVKSYSEVKDPNRHYMDLTMQFNNGIDSTFVFDVTEQVRRQWKGGVITVELDLDTIPIPSRKGGSGFDAVVKDFEDGGTHVIDL